MTPLRVAVVVPVYGNEATLRPLHARLAAALGGRHWRLRLVVDASPDGSLAVARSLAAGDPRVGVTALAVNRGQHRALAPRQAAQVAAALTGLPPDAGACLALGPAVRDAVVRAVLAGDAPSVVLATCLAGTPLTSLPVARDRRPVGDSAWTTGARLRQSVRSLAWAVSGSRAGRPDPSSRPAAPRSASGTAPRR